MTHCCDEKESEIEALRARQGHVLKTVLAVNAVMFIVEAAAGILASSTALLADSLDMLGDALIYGFSLYVIARSRRWRAASALLKGVVMAALGAAVLVEAVRRTVYPVVPVAGIIGAVGFLALAANAICFALLWRHRADDINMQSTWLCSRNDLIANVSVLFAAAGVWVFESGWPDVLIGSVIATIILRSSVHVLTGSIREWRLSSSIPKTP
jgi:cation diffusion facilitator family transporter